MEPLGVHQFPFLCNLEIQFDLSQQLPSFYKLVAFLVLCVYLLFALLADDKGVIRMMQYLSWRLYLTCIY